MDEIFKKIGTTQTLSQKIERNIERAIREKKLVVGAKLPSERELCEMFAVSRTALREALRRLSARGLIEIKKGSGMFVKRIEMKDAIKSLNLYYDLKFDNNLISQIIEVRMAFEPEIARMAALNRTDEDLKLMEQNLIDFAKCDPDNTQLESDIDNKFHLLVARATENPIVIVTMEPVHNLLPRMRSFIYANIEGEKEITLGFHKEIVNAIREGDSDRAYEKMQAHLSRNLEVFNKFLKQSLP
ncbi:FadR/GntR family transcriptional regulator [Sunxiuqinia sp. A32]|uniref:FadR/GntR family transcriptional regulator n=1 Tax=Sunxiuqinia sp. A32 TaxID=3461496 RepID=UPI004045BEFF